MKKLLVALVVVLGLLVGADRLAAAAAGRAVAGRLRTSAGLSTTPSVKITGFPFLTQALRGRYDALQVHAKDVRQDGVTVTALDARLRDVRVPLSDVLGGHVRSVPVGSLSARARVSYAELSAASGNRHLQFSPAQDGAVRVAGDLSVLGAGVKAAAVSRLSLQGSTLVLTSQTAKVGGVDLGGLASGLDLKVPVGGLPYGLRPTGVSTGPDGVVLRAEGGATVLRP